MKKTIRLSVSHLRRGFRASEFKAGALYELAFRDLLEATDDGPNWELGPDDLALQIRDDASDARRERDRADEEVVCPCVLIVIVSRSPSENVKGQENSLWRDGGWNKVKNPHSGTKNKDAFQKLVKDTLTLAGFPTYCLFVREVDLSDGKYAPFFTKNAKGELQSSMDYGKSEKLMEAIRQKLGADGTTRCFTICIVRSIEKPNAAFGPVWKGGMTPCDPVPVPKGTPPSPFAPKVWTFAWTWTMKSQNFSFVPDSMESWAIAHEIFHQGGCTHAKDNLLYPDGNGQPDPGLVPKEAERDANDLLNPKPNAACKPGKDDLKKLHDYAKANKCCDIKKPKGSSVL